MKRIEKDCFTLIISCSELEIVNLPCVQLGIRKKKSAPVICLKYKAALFCYIKHADSSFTRAELQFSHQVL